MTELQINATPARQAQSAATTRRLEGARPTVASGQKPQVSGSQPPASADADLAALLPEALAAEPALQGKTLAGLAKEYLHAQKLIGRKGVPLPSQDDDEEGWRAAHEALGCPFEAQDYDFGADARPLWYSETMAEALKGMMHDAGLSQRQAKRLHAAYIAFLDEQMQAVEQATEARAQELRRFLEAKPESERQRFVRMVERGARVLELDEDLMVEMPEVFQDVRVLTLLAQLGEADVSDLAGARQSAASQDPQEALNALNADSGHLAAFLNRGHPGHADAKAKRAALLGQLSEAVKVGPVSRSLTPPQSQG